MSLPPRLTTSHSSQRSYPRPPPHDPATTARDTTVQSQSPLLPPAKRRVFPTTNGVGLCNARHGPIHAHTAEPRLLGKNHHRCPASCQPGTVQYDLFVPDICAYIGGSTAASAAAAEAEGGSVGRATSIDPRRRPEQRHCRLPPSWPTLLQPAHTDRINITKSAPQHWTRGGTEEKPRVGRRSGQVRAGSIR